MTQSLAVWLRTREVDSIAQWPAARVSAAQVAQAMADGWIVGEVNAAGARSKAELLKRFQRDLDFPDTFGQNWDALVDCLTDWHAGSARRLVIVNTPSASLSANLRAALESVASRTLAITLATATKQPGLVHLA